MLERNHQEQTDQVVAQKANRESQAAELETKIADLATQIDAVQQELATLNAIPAPTAMQRSRIDQLNSRLEELNQQKQDAESDLALAQSDIVELDKYLANNTYEEPLMRHTNTLDRIHERVDIPNGEQERNVRRDLMWEKASGFQSPTPEPVCTDQFFNYQVAANKTTYLLAYLQSGQHEFTISAYDSSSREGEVATTQFQATPSSNSIELSWTPPIERTDGTPVTISEISGYHITHKVVGDANNCLQQPAPVQPQNCTIIDPQEILVSGTTNSYVIPNLPFGKYSFRLTAIDMEGLESNPATDTFTSTQADQEANLSWSTPTTRLNGTALNPSEIVQYRITYGAADESQNTCY